MNKEIQIKTTHLPHDANNAKDTVRHDLIAQYAPKNRFTVVKDTGPFERLSLSIDGNTLGGTTKNVLCLWNTRTNENIGRFVFGARVNHHALSADGQFALAADENAVIHLVDVVFNTVAAIARHDEPIRAVALGTASAAFGDCNGTVVIFDPDDYRTASRIQCDSAIQALRFAPGDDVLTVNLVNAALIYRLADKRMLASYGVDRAPPPASETPPIAAISHGQYGISVYDKTTGRAAFNIPVSGANFDYAPDGSIIATGADGHVNLWDGVNGSTTKQVRTFVDSVADVKISADGSCFYVCGDGISIEHFSTNGQRLRSYTDVRCELMAAEVTADCRHLVVSDQTGVVTVYDLVSGSPTRYFQHRCCISKQAITGSLVATGGHDGFAKILDLDTGETVFSASCAGKPVQGISLDGDGHVVAGNLLGMILLYEITSGALVREYHGNTAAIRCLRVSPCKRYLLSTADNGLVLVFEYGTGRLLNRFHEPAIVYSADFDEAGDHIYFGNGVGEIIKARSDAADIVRRWYLHRCDVRSIHIAQQKLCSIGIRGDAHILDLQTETSLLDCPVETRPFRRIAFLNYNGTRLVTGGQDGCLTIRDAETGLAVAELHHLGEGYFWGTRDRHPAEGGDCFWTDREELVQTYSQTAGIESLMPESSEERAEFIAGRRNRTVTMSVVGLSPAACMPPREEVAWDWCHTPALLSHLGSGSNLDTN